MASTSIHIGNMREAIEQGVVPGAFAEDRTVFEFPTLAYVGSRGATHLWTIRVRLLHGAKYVPITDEMLGQPTPDLPGHKAEITVESLQQGGKTRDVVPTYVSAGKNLGKKSATNPVTQALRDALGLFNKQKKRADIIDAADVETDADDGDAGPRGGPAPEEADADIVSDFDAMPPPMLIKKLGDSREATLTPADFKDGITAQRKFNGVHYVVYARSGPDGGRRLVRYSRSGTPYPGQNHVAAELLPMFATAPRIAPGEYGTPAAPATPADRRVLEAYGALSPKGDPAPYFDGELYKYGKTLNWISGQARRGDDEGILEFHIFDVFFPYAKAAGHDMASRDRQAYLKAFFANADAAGQAHPHVVPVENFLAASMSELNELAKRFVEKEKYEGAIARKDRAGYRYSYSNYHSANLVKIKPIFDAEFPVVGFTQGVRGKDVGAVIWECEVPKPVDPRDKTFTVVPKDMTYEDRKALFLCLGAKVDGPGGKTVTRFERDLKGLPLTVEYREISAKTGKPLQAKALAFRTYEAGPEVDPVKRLFDECLPSRRPKPRGAVRATPSASVKK